MDDNLSWNCLKRLSVNSFGFVMSCDLLISVLNLFRSM